jgi:hypothetical protein
MPYLGGLDFLWVFLGNVSELENVFLSEIGIVVKAKLGVHANGISGLNEDCLLKRDCSSA